MPPIAVKQAVRIALDYFKDLYDTGGLRDIRLEEVELTEDGKFWLVTLGFDRPVPQAIFEAFGAPKYQREYKVLKIDSSRGEVHGMKIRES